MSIADVKSAAAEIISRAEQLRSGKLNKVDSMAAFAAIEKGIAAFEQYISPYRAEALPAGNETLPGQAGFKKEAADTAPMPGGKPKRVRLLGKGERSSFLKSAGIDEDYLKEVIARKKKGMSEEERVAYTLYSTNAYGKLANRLFGKYTVMITGRFDRELQGFYQALRASGIKVLSKTYISMILLSALIAFFAAWLLAAVFFKAPGIAFQILRGFFIGIIASAIAGGAMFFYPSSAAKSGESKIKQDLPFVIINMAAVAGSGAKPISIFKTILSSREYPGIRDEIKKIVNYVNLFGYDLSTALKAVARRTPSLRFKDLLDGIVNTIESGGDLKEYLNAMADDALTTYRLERTKAVEQIGTYSDIYTTVLIAAPLLFFVTLAIIQTMGGQIGGVSVATLSTIGTYVAIPFLNVIFIIFIDAVQPQG